MVGLAIFDLVYRKNVRMRMEEFPEKLVNLFSPVKREKADLMVDFTSFIDEVKSLEQKVLNSNSKQRQYHPMFGDISTKEWYYLIEFHMWQHNKQKKKIMSILHTKRSV